MRIGHGYDVHAFTSGDHVMLGGVRILHAKGLRAHSDGDVVLHALCDALLGAAALGDIGRHFPDTDPKWRGADSRLLLKEVVKLLAAKKLKPAQVKELRKRVKAGEDKATVAAAFGISRPSIYNYMA